ncbi:hypothetical protein JHK87_021961 [Glycine soja]|nr:hypothetical protein JHK87_021961 [Glycine soja]
MSNVNDRWVTMAMADDTLVADQLLLLRHHHRPSVIRRWVRRQRRTPRLPVTGYEGNTRKTALTHPSASKAVDESETAADKRRARKKRILRDLKLEHKISLDENEDLRDVRLLDLNSRRILKTAQAILDPPKSVDTANLGSEQILEGKPTPVCSAASAPPSNQPEIGGQKPPLLLPDLNQPSEEYLTEFLGFSQ